MKTADVLDIIEALLRVSGHPDFVGEIRRYGKDAGPGGNSPPGIVATHQSGAESMIWAATGKPAPKPAPLPIDWPAPQLRAPRLLMLVSRLLDEARPEVFTSWQTVAFDGVHMSPSGLQITAADGEPAYLRVTSTSGAGGSKAEALEPPHLEYQIPQGVRSWRQAVSAHPAGLA